MQKTETLVIFEDQLKGLMPFLSYNLTLAHAAYMKHDLAAGAFHHIRERHALAALLTDTAQLHDDMTEGAVFENAASLFIDLKDVLPDLPDPLRADATTRVAAFRQLYSANGFTAEQPWLRIPARPAAAPMR